MSDAPARAALMSAVTTEHFVLQTAISTTVNEGSARASLYIYALSSALVAMGFMAQTEALMPFLAAVLPALFLLGVVTVLRLVDIAMENMQAHMGIARIRAFYRQLGGEAVGQFSPETGRWPEGAEPSLKIGPLVGLVTTAASMIAAVNAFVAGVGAALIVLTLTAAPFALGAGVGAACALALFLAFYVYQSYRIGDVAKGVDGSKPG